MIEVLKQALEALENITDAIYVNSEQEANAVEKAFEAITSLHQAIAELESQEPVAWCIWFCGGIVGFFDKQDEAIEEFRQRNQEYPDESRKLVPLYTHPPRRTWVGLTDERREQLIQKCWSEYIAGKEDGTTFGEWISVAIEAELKEKNNA